MFNVYKEIGGYLQGAQKAGAGSRRAPHGVFNAPTPENKQDKKQQVNAFSVSSYQPPLATPETPLTKTGFANMSSMSIDTASTATPSPSDKSFLKSP